MKYFNILLIIITISACQFKSPRKKGEPSEKEVLYYIYCNHPTKGRKYYIVNQETWNHPHGFRSANWLFTDIEGREVKTSMGCYTDSRLRKE